MEIEHINIDLLRPLENNPRIISGKARRKLRDSIRTFGLFKPLLAWRDSDGDAIVIGGNQRLSILKDMTEAGDDVPTNVPVIWFDGNESEARTVALRDNQSDGEWDWNLLASYVDELDGLDGDDSLTLDLTGLDSATLNDLKSLSIEEWGQPEGQKCEHDKDEAESVRSHKHPEQNYLDHRFAIFTVGNLRGKVTLDIYGRWLQAFEGYSKRLDTTDVGIIIGSMLEDWGSVR